MSDIIAPKVTFGRDGAAHTANIWTHDGQHFMARADDPLLALHMVTIHARASAVGLTRTPAHCDECRTVEGQQHLTWCPQGPKAMYP